MLRKHAPFLALLLLYLLLGTLYATRTPLWQAPDEPAHYNYIRQLAEGDFPIMEFGDYDEAYRNQVVSSRFDPSYAIDGFEYEDYQPPLYYLLQTPVYLSADGSPIALRIFSILLGALTVFLAYLTGLNLFPSRPYLALTIAAFVALLPQHLAIISSVNNDALAEALVAAMLFVATKRPQTTNHRPQTTIPYVSCNTQYAILSLLLGLAFLTKVTAYLMAGALGAWLLWLYWGDWRGLWRTGLRLFVPALLIGLVWWGRNVVTYPGPDFLGTMMHDRVVVGQKETGDWIAQIGVSDALAAFGKNSFRSFWGQFGWMCCPMPSWTYSPLWILSLSGVVGFIVWLLRRRKRIVSKNSTANYIIFGTLLGLNLLLFVTYNLRFVQHQGRYLFVSLIPIATALTLGWQICLAPLTKLHPKTIQLLPLILIIGLTGLNLLVVRSVLPCMTVMGC